MARLVEQRVLVRVAVAAVHAANEAERVAGLHRAHLERLDLGVGDHRRVLVEHLLAAEVGLERLEPQRALGEVALLAASADVELVDEPERGEPSRRRVARLGTASAAGRASATSIRSSPASDQARTTAASPSSLARGRAIASPHELLDDRAYARRALRVARPPRPQASARPHRPPPERPRCR